MSDQAMSRIRSVPTDDVASISAGVGGVGDGRIDVALAGLQNGGAVRRLGALRAPLRRSVDPAVADVAGARRGHLAESPNGAVQLWRLA